MYVSKVLHRVFNTLFSNYISSAPSSDQNCVDNIVHFQNYTKLFVMRARVSDYHRISFVITFRIFRKVYHQRFYHYIIRCSALRQVL